MKQTEVLPKEGMITQNYVKSLLLSRLFARESSEALSITSPSSISTTKRDEKRNSESVSRLVLCAISAVTKLTYAFESSIVSLQPSICAAIIQVGNRSLL
jgi:hypothetical protein